ncbi:MAG: CHAT domain-containing tetratricopeptide repeat protein [Acidobacteriota bacterium]
MAELEYKPEQTKASSRAVVLQLALKVLALNTNAPGDARKQHEAGVALLLIRRPLEAVPYLERSVALSPGSATYWNDLAAAKLEAGRSANPQFILEALTAIDRAIDLQPRAPAALFNRALILNALKLPSLAAPAFRACMSAEAVSGWGKEARRRLASGMVAPRSEQWKRELVRLRAAVERGDVHTVQEIVDSFPQESRTWGELIFLGGWADAEAAATSSAGDLKVARAIGAALRRSTGESLLADAVSAIDGAAQPRRAALRDGQQLYGRARKLYRDRRVSEALPMFDAAAGRFRQGRTPMSAVAEYYIANSLHDLGRHAEALALIDSILGRVPSGHRALRAQLLWERGTVLTRTGRLTDALVAQRKAAELFDALGEVVNASHMVNATALTLSLLGRRDEAWMMRLSLFERVSRFGDAALLQTVLDSTARTEALAQHWPEAFSLLTLSVDPAVRVNPRVMATSFLWRALAGTRLGWSTGAADVEVARQMARAVADPVLRQSVLNEANFTDGILAVQREPRRAKELLTRYIDAGSEACDAYLLPEAFLARARLRRDTGDDSGAVADLVEASWWLDQRRNDSSDEYRDAYFPTGDSVRRELVDVLCRRGEYWNAFLAAAETTERSGMPSDRRTVLAGFPADTVAVRYVVLPQRLVVFLLSSRTFETVVVPIPREALASAASHLVEAILADREAEIGGVSRQLSGWLLEPICRQLRNAQRLVVVADETLASVPFSMLPYGPKKEALIQSVELVFRSRVSSRADRRGNPSRVRPVLAVGDPRFDPNLFPSLTRLSAAGDEARNVAAIYGQHDILTDTAATPAAVIAGLNRAAVADFGTHAILVPNAPSRSFLVFASSGDDAGTLNVDQIARLPLGSLRLVVLAGCRTAAHTTGGGTATSIALAFTRAGAQNAIGSLWDMDDSVAWSWSVALHRRILAGMTPAAALRETQVAMLHSPDPTTRRTSSWAGLRIYGSD